MKILVGSDNYKKIRYMLDTDTNSVFMCKEKEGADFTLEEFMKIQKERKERYEFLQDAKNLTLEEKKEFDDLHKQLQFEIRIEKSDTCIIILTSEGRERIVLEDNSKVFLKLFSPRVIYQERVYDELDKWIIL